MRLWRLTKAAYALDRVCIGTAFRGGRWNPIGLPALYAASSMALCALETFVHLGSAKHPPLVLVAVDVPDGSVILEPSLAQLPLGWDSMPTSSSAQAFGGRWLSEGTQMALRVPSVIVPEETIVMLNPRHSDFQKVGLSIVRRFTFDPRMFK
jgi:RES domain-containing protein